jgi:putative transposase
MARARLIARRVPKRRTGTEPDGSSSNLPKQAELLNIPRAEWERARRRLRFVKILARRKGASAGAFSTVAKKARVSIRTLYRWVNLWRGDPTLTALLRVKRGPKRGARRLDLERETIIDRALDVWLSSREVLPVSRAVEEVNRQCRAAGFPGVARNTLMLRLKARGGPSRSRLVPRTTENIPATRRALGIVQVDHTLVDVIVVEEGTRRPIGRPWITVVFDVATRAVLGFHATLESPSATSVAMALSMACRPKGASLRRVDVDVEWPMAGLPEVLHLDNGREFHSEALRRGCERHDIRLTYRPAGQPHTGGHIERYLGTLMRRIHGLPGTTRSNPEARGNYPSAKRSSLTLAELERWLTLEIAGRYHSAVHRGLHLSPAAAWRNAIRGRALRTPLKPKELAIDFFPAVARKIGRTGFQFLYIRYWDPLLPRLFSAPGRTWVRYDPRNLARVFVPLPGRDEYLEVPYADLRRPPISLSEQQAAVREILDRGRRSANEDAMFATIEQQRRLVDKALSKTRNRRKAARRPVVALDTLLPTAAPTSPATSLNFKKPAVPFPGEVWKS